MPENLGRAGWVATTITKATVWRYIMLTTWLNRWTRRATSSSPQFVAHNIDHCYRYMPVHRLECQLSTAWFTSRAPQSQPIVALDSSSDLTQANGRHHSHLCTLTPGLATRPNRMPAQAERLNAQIIGYTCDGRSWLRYCSCGAALASRTPTQLPSVGSPEAVNSGSSSI